MVLFNKINKFVLFYILLSLSQYALKENLKHKAIEKSYRACFRCDTQYPHPPHHFRKDQSNFPTPVPKCIIQKNFFWPLKASLLPV